MHISPLSKDNEEPKEKTSILMVSFIVLILIAVFGLFLTDLFLLIKESSAGLMTSMIL
jgi:hypothetical protein